MTALQAGGSLFVTGGTGFLGRNMLPRLRALLPHMSRITLLSRRASLPASIDPGVRLLKGDLSHPDCWLAEMAQHDCVLWMAADRDHSKRYSALRAANVDSVRTAVRCLEIGGRTHHFIYVSSVSAVDQPDGACRPIHEGSPAVPRTDYGRSKLEAERTVAGSRLHSTVLRLPFLYGPGHSSSSFLSWCRMAAHSRLLRSRLYPGTLSLLYAADLAQVIATVLARGVDPGKRHQLLCVSDGSIYRMSDLVAMVGDLFGMLPVPRQYRVGPGVRRLLLHTRLGYWQHAAFTPDFFAVDSSRMRKQFESLVFTPALQGLRTSYGIG